MDGAALFGSVEATAVGIISSGTEISNVLACRCHDLCQVRSANRYTIFRVDRFGGTPSAVVKRHGDHALPLTGAKFHPTDGEKIPALSFFLPSVPYSVSCVLYNFI